MSQNSDILKHLQTHTIEPLEALNLYGVMRLSPRIGELIAAGHSITTTIIKHNGKRFAQYSLRG